MLISSLSKAAVHVGRVLHTVAREKPSFVDFLTPSDQVDEDTTCKIHRIISQRTPDDSSLYFLGETYLGLSIQQGLVIDNYLKACRLKSFHEILNSEQFDPE